MYKTLLCLLFICPTLSVAGEVRNVNFAVFQKIDKNMEYEAVVEGKFADFIAAMKGAQLMALTHTAGAIEGDVITLQTSVLRDEAGAFSDYGIDCQLSFRDESSGKNLSFLLGGMCKIIHEGRGQHSKVIYAIPHTNVPDTTQGYDGWFMLDEDKSTGIVFYANVGS